MKIGDILIGKKELTKSYYDKVYDIVVPYQKYVITDVYEDFIEVCDNIFSNKHANKVSDYFYTEEEYRKMKMNTIRNDSEV